MWLVTFETNQMFILTSVLYLSPLFKLLDNYVFNRIKVKVPRNRPEGPHWEGG
jgi:hypothetical protein